MSNDAIKEVKKTANDVAENATDTAKKGAQQVKKSTKDWLSYVEKHPAQSLIFGGIALLAVKGLLTCCGGSKE